MFLLGQDHPPRLGQVVVRDMRPTTKHYYMDMRIRWNSLCSFHNAAYLRHSYHMDGSGDIMAFYLEAIRGKFNEERYRQIKPGYYRVTGKARG